MSAASLNLLRWRLGVESRSLAHTGLHQMCGGQEAGEGRAERPCGSLGFPCTLRKTPQRHLEHVWTGVRAGRFPPRVNVWVQGVYIAPLSLFSSCLLLQSQCLSHLDHFLDYVAHKVRKRRERKTNKMKLLSAFSF